MFTCVLRQSWILPPNLSGGADRVGGQLRGDKECPISGVPRSVRVWKKVPESGVWIRVTRVEGSCSVTPIW